MFFLNVDKHSYKIISFIINNIIITKIVNRANNALNEIFPFFWGVSFLLSFVTLLSFLLSFVTFVTLLSFLQLIATLLSFRLFSPLFICSKSLIQIAKLLFLKFQ